VLRRLVRAGAEQEVRDSMDVEDDIMKAFQDQARESADLRQALAAKEQVIEQLIEEKDQVIEEKDQVIEKKDQVIEEKDRLIADLKRRLSPGR
jgi:predicted RNase H-like nuclease (RuvC/YqgF family)